MDRLAQLQDITTPEPISQFPMAIGWWLLLALIILSVFTFIVKMNQYNTLRKIQKNAIKQINQQSPTLSETVRILKMAAMAYFPRNEIAALSGMQLADYLIGKLPEKAKTSFITKTSNAWQQLYQKNGGTQINSDFNQAALLWLKTALPPKSVKTTVKKQEANHD